MINRGCKTEIISAYRKNDFYFIFPLTYEHVVIFFRKFGMRMCVKLRKLLQATEQFEQRSNSWKNKEKRNEHER